MLADMGYATRRDRAFAAHRRVACRSFGTTRLHSSLLALPPQTPLSRPREVVVQGGTVYGAKDVILRQILITGTGN
jgi:hypothetical protein